MAAKACFSAAGGAYAARTWNGGPSIRHAGRRLSAFGFPHPAAMPPLSRRRNRPNLTDTSDRPAPIAAEPEHTDLMAEPTAQAPAEAAIASEPPPDAAP